MAPVAVVLARTEETVVAVTGVRAFPTGFSFTLNLRLRNLHPRERRGFWPFPEFGYHGARTVPADAFRLTIEFADGRSVNNLDPVPSDPSVPARRGGHPRGVRGRGAPVVRRPVLLRRLTPLAEVRADRGTDRDAVR
jgi:hypothetical protein